MATYNLDLRRDLARGLKAARVRAKLGSAEAAQELTKRGLNCRRGTLLAWERGHGTTSREPYASDLPVIAEMYGCAVGDLFRPEPPADGNSRLPPMHRDSQSTDSQFTSAKPANGAVFDARSGAGGASPTRNGLNGAAHETAESPAGSSRGHWGG